MTNEFFLSRLNRLPHVLTFAGQSTPWPTALRDVCSDTAINEQLHRAIEQANQKVSPIAGEILATHGQLVDIFNYEPNAAGLGRAAEATVSIEGIAASQYGAILDLNNLGYDVTQANLKAVLGHSQGILAAHMVQAIQDKQSIASAEDQITEILAIAQLIGTAGTRRAREINLQARVNDATPMLSVKGATHTQITTLIERVYAKQSKGEISIAVTNAPTHFVLSGYPEDLSALEHEAQAEAKHQAKLREEKQRGGTPFNPVMEYLEVTLPFHSPLMQPAVEQTVAWANVCGIHEEKARILAEEVLINHVDWNTKLHNLLQDEAVNKELWLVDIGPGNTLGKLITNVAQGTGVGIIEATTMTERSALATLENDPAKLLNYQDFAPRLVETPAGAKLVTKFSELTGKPPILLPGMTPTTVDPEIVAAAANAGYWAEMAGGGQVTAEVFDKHIAQLEELLDEGRTVEFNAMFMDRYLWNLQFGSTAIVPKKRASGAPIDGVVISAGIPELDEAKQLIQKLRQDGLPYVSFKPGTVDQIRQVIRIAKAVAPTTIMVQVEGGEAGGHHSWEALDDLLIETYAQVRECSNLVLVVGGGIGTPQRAADYISGEWANAYDLKNMPVDGVLVGTAVMTAKEAHTSHEVKQQLVETQGINAATVSDDPFAPQANHWVPSGKSIDGISSGLSHLHADIYELENDSAACGRLLVHVMKHPEELETRKQEIIEALNRTAKPYFGDLNEMTYAQWAQRFAQLSFPWVDPTYADRFYHLLQRIEARVCSTDSGEFESRLFASESSTDSTLLTRDDILNDPQPALKRLLEVYPQAAELTVVPSDVAWFTVLVREYPKPMPFVPVIDNDLLRWWGQDQLWQSEDERYTADSVRAIPGPISVSGITTINEPVADILARFEQAAINRVQEKVADVKLAFAVLHGADDAESFIRQSPNISWVGHITDNPAYGTKKGDTQYEIRPFDPASGRYDLDIHLDTFWDNDVDGGASKHAVRNIIVPLILDGTVGSVPIVDRERLIDDVYAMLAATAGIGNTAITGDKLTQMPLVEKDDDLEQFPFGKAHAQYTLSANLGADHAAATGAALPTDLQLSNITPDALVGPAWPAIYAALGSVQVHNYPVIEGLLNAVHLDHLIEFEVNQETLLQHVGEQISLTSWAEQYQESASGRVVTIHVTHTSADGTVLARETERFAIRGRVFSDELPKEAAEYGDAPHAQINATPRRLLRRMKVTAPHDMTAFARTSGDFNPIHTSVRGAKISGLSAPLVHGMWLSATAQHAVQALDNNGTHYEIAGWTYNMYGMVQLDDEVEISVERVGKVAHAGMALEVTCRIEGQLVSRATALIRTPRSAFVYPGQGIQKQGMALDERTQSTAARDVWERADKLTRSKLGFSIIGLVRDNPKTLTANGVTYQHPEGLLNLTQFTQVALATVAFAQTARLREAGADLWPAYFAGHSLGEYNALSAFANVIPLETVLELVFHRGSTMHHLIERDEQGRSNYRMGALRPNQFGVDDSGVNDYIEQISKQSGEFLEIVNYNLAGQQYAVAGTIAGLKALQADATARAKAFGGKPPFMLVPGIDVPFHSTLLRKGVPEFRDKLDALLPQHIEYRERLVGRYIPNLVASPFELTREFAQKILDVVPSERIATALNDDAVWEDLAADDQKLGRLLLTELLSWQFASPVRWIETQALLFNKQNHGGLGVEEFVEVGLGNAPTLANLGAKTLSLPEFSDARTVVYNVGRDAGRVYMTDTDSLVPDEVEDEVQPTPQTDAQPAEATTPVTSTPVAQAAPTAPAVAQPAASSSAPAADLPYSASDAIVTLLAYSAKVRPDQIGDGDTTDTLTNGVSSRRNQLLMDISSELGVASVDGAAEASIDALKTLVNKVAPNYKAFGPVVSDIARERIRGLFGAAGVKIANIEKRVTQVWQLPAGWVHHVVSALLLETREGASSRGGDLASLETQPVSNEAQANTLIDQAIQSVAAAHGVQVAMPQAGGSAGGSMVDSAALQEFAAKVTGEKGVLAQTARYILNTLGVKEPEAQEEDNSNEAVVRAVEAELGSDWVKQVEPRFDAAKIIQYDDRWASAREDLARAFYTKNIAELNGSFIGLGEAVSKEALWFAQHTDSDELQEAFKHIAQQALETANSSASHGGKHAGSHSSNVPAEQRFTHDIAIVTGVSANSIAGSVVERLLEGGATVVATSHSFKPSIKEWAKQTYRQHACEGAQLWLVPANLSSFRDVDALVQWVGSEQKKTSGASTTVIKPAYEPTLFFPFAAPPVHGTLADSGQLFESQARLMLWGVERAIAGLSAIGSDTNVQHRMHVVLPGSPNRGIFGGDGAYGEVKSAFDALVNRSHAERIWSDRVTFAHPRIGWVHGTGLMGGNDPLVEIVEEQGIHTYSTEQMADRLLALCTEEARNKALNAPLDVDLTGGLGSDPIDISALRTQAMERAAAQSHNVDSDENAALTLKALPNPLVRKQPEVNLEDWSTVSARPEDEIVIVSIGELGTWGSGRTRTQAELGIHSDGTVDLSAGAVLELAWNMGLLSWQESPKPAWVDTDGNIVEEEDIAQRYRDEVIARSGIRPFDDGMGADYINGTDEEEAEVYLDQDVTFSVPTREIAEEYIKLDEAHTSIANDPESGEWNVTRHAGSMIRVPRRATMTRTVGGQFPKGFDPTRWGIPASMVGDVDQIALWNIVTAVDAYLSAGFTPTEILQSIHPSQVASTQGTGFGGMSSMRKLYLDRFLNHEIPTDILQEALPNVVAAHVMQSYIGGYGAMIQPVSACATAAVSLEEGVDKIALGKADFVVTGAIDDIGVESVIGFGNMNATANSAEMYGKGIDSRFFSRANDRRRGGFLEAQGGGTILITRGDKALELGLPVAAVIGFVHSYADGAHTSIPAPGLGALAAAQGGTNSKLVKNLETLGVSADDIAVVSKHDTSTNANDPNESELHNTIAHAIGRSEGNPLFVISQKTLTGHAKGGACIFQVNGLTQLFASGMLPANASLDCVDPKLENDDYMVWMRQPLRIGGGHNVYGENTAGKPVKAGLATSLGFGHVSGFIALVHPGAFEAAVAHTAGVEALNEWRTKANTRLMKGQRRLEEGMMGNAHLYEPIDNRRFYEDSRHYNAHEIEKSMLLNPNARLNSDGYFEA